MTRPIQSRTEEYEKTRQSLQKDPLYRETLRAGFDYDTGDPFRDIAYHLVNGHGNKNIVLRTSGGYIVEATAKQVRSKFPNSNTVDVIHEFNPRHPLYLIEPPYFTRVASALSTHVREAMMRRESITLETDVESPFKEGTR